MDRSIIGEDEWSRPLGIHAEDEGNIYLVNQSQSILRYSPDGEFLDQWHQAAVGEKRQQPVAMHIDGNTVYVAFAAGTMPGIWTLDLDGKAIERVVEFVPTADGGLETFANDLAIAPTGDVFTVDTFARTARWYSPEGELKSEWPLDSGSERTLGFPYIAVSNTGTVYISDGGTRQILVFEPVSE